MREFFCALLFVFAGGLKVAKADTVGYPMLLRVDMTARTADELPEAEGGAWFAEDTDGLLGGADGLASASSGKTLNERDGSGRVPEPGTLALLTTGLVGIAMRRRVAA
jgi:hypothetical protein